MDEKQKTCLTDEKSYVLDVSDFKEIFERCCEYEDKELIEHIEFKPLIEYVISLTQKKIMKKAVPREKYDKLKADNWFLTKRNNYLRRRLTVRNDG